MSLEAGQCLPPPITHHTLLVVVQNNGEVERDSTMSMKIRVCVHEKKLRFSNWLYNNTFSQEVI